MAEQLSLDLRVQQHQVAEDKAGEFLAQLKKYKGGERTHRNRTGLNVSPVSEYAEVLKETAFVASDDDLPSVFFESQPKENGR